MKTYEKYLLTEEYRIDEKMTATKALNKLRTKISTAKTPIEVRLAMSMIAKFIRTFTDSWTSEISDEIMSLYQDAVDRMDKM